MGINVAKSLRKAKGSVQKLGRKVDKKVGGAAGWSKLTGGAAAVVALVPGVGAPIAAGLALLEERPRGARCRSRAAVVDRPRAALVGADLERVRAVRLQQERDLAERARDLELVGHAASGRRAKGGRWAAGRS